MNSYQMAKLLSMISEKEEPKSYPTIEGQIEVLKDFISVEGVNRFKVGDMVKRNSYGVKRYKAPNEKQVAMVCEVFDRVMMDERSCPIHGAIAIIYPDGELLSHTVDFRYYEKA